MPIGTWLGLSMAVVSRPGPCKLRVGDTLPFIEPRISGKRIIVLANSAVFPFYKFNILLRFTTLYNGVQCKCNSSTTWSIWYWKCTWFDMIFD